MSNRKDKSVFALQRLCVLIPARDPGSVLLSLTRSLRDAGIENIIVVDDGSGPSASSTFSQLEAIDGIRVLQHPRNLGKGRALKTGFDFIQKRLPETLGVITADCDGQHTVEDILRIAAAFSQQPQLPVIGSRSLDRGVPRRSAFGNRVTRSLFARLTHSRLSDTQSGLRAFPASLLPELLTLPGERYEYELAVLVHLCRSAHCPHEVPIATIYLEGNRSSHFRPLRDSIRIGLALARMAVRRSQP